MHQQGPNILIVQEKQQFPYGCYIGLGATQIILGVIGIACTAAKLGLLCRSEAVCTVVGLPGIAGYNAALYICCLLFMVTGIIGVCMNHSQEKNRVCLGSAFCGLSVFCIFLAIFVWFAAVAELWFSFLITAFGATDEYRTAVLASSYLIWIVGLVGFIEMIIAIVSSSVWCCNCCGSYKEKEDADYPQAYQMGQPADYNQRYYPQGPGLATHPNQEYNPQYNPQRHNHVHKSQAEDMDKYTRGRDNLYDPYGYNRASSRNDMYTSNQGNSSTPEWRSHGRYIDGYPGYGRY